MSISRLLKNTIFKILLGRDRSQIAQGVKYAKHNADLTPIP